MGAGVTYGQFLGTEEQGLQTSDDEITNEVVLDQGLTDIN